MPRSFNFLPTPGTMESPRFWLQAMVIALAITNALALLLYFAPPGGSRSELAEQEASLRSQIAAASGETAKQRTVTQKVELGATQSSEFLNQYIIPKRLAYAEIISEIQRIAKVSGVAEKDATYSEEPIEGTADLTQISSTANYEGTYANLRKFLYEVDRSPFLIMMESLQVAPQQRGNQINSSIKFQAVIQDDLTVAGPMRGHP